MTCRPIFKANRHRGPRIGRKQRLSAAMKGVVFSWMVAFTWVGCSAEIVTPANASNQGETAAVAKGDSPIAFDGSIDWDEVARRCGAPAEDEPVVYGNDFEWGYSREDMARHFDEMYSSGKRLMDRAYVDEDSGRFVMPVSEMWGGYVVLPKRLVENVRMHIEKALDRGYAEYVFFPDMGHSHLFIPQDNWDFDYADYPVAEFGKMYSQLFDDPGLKVLYHTAEQLQLLDEDDNVLPDRHIQWRFFTRNVIGDNNWAGRIDLLHEPESEANTSRDLKGHHYYGGGFNLTATKDGCFPFVHNGYLFYFDISMSDLPYETSDDGSIFR